jgi:hypothetical protein
MTEGKGEDKRSREERRLSGRFRGRFGLGIYALEDDATTKHPKIAEADDQQQKSDPPSPGTKHDPPLGRVD